MDICFLIQVYLPELFFKFWFQIFSNDRNWECYFERLFAANFDLLLCSVGKDVLSSKYICQNFDSKYFQMIEIGNVTLRDCLLPTLTYYCAQ